MCDWIETPWDKRAFGIDTYEIKIINEQTMKSLEGIPGHFTIKVNPLQSKKLLHDYGFYYCDTLIEPFCHKTSFHPWFREGISVKPNLDPEQAQALSKGIFQFDRFHRDFHISDEDADQRYTFWIEDIAMKGMIYGLWYHDELAGFFACQDQHILLHAMNKSFQGKGLAKYFWSGVCQTLFDRGFDELSSSISAANLAVLNLYRSLGFSFRNAIDIYHKWNPPKN